MTRWVSCLVVATLAQLVVCAAAAGAQETIKLNVFAPPVLPKAPVYLNVTLSNPTDVSVLELKQTISFRQEHLRFVRARLGIAGDIAAATLAVELRSAAGEKVESADAAESIGITLTGKSPLGTGPLVELEFRQVDGKERAIRMRQVAEIHDREGKVMPLVVADTNVSVSKTLAPAPLKVFACFFYMH